MSDHFVISRPAPEPDPAAAPYDKRRLSYATTFTNPVASSVIRTMEWMTGKLTLLRLIRRFERRGAPHGQAFWSAALQVMGIDVRTPAEQVARLPATGPLIVVANHPHGLVDGMVLAELIGRRRTDYRILTRSLLTGVEEVARFMIPVPFPHEEGAQARFLEMRREAMAHLARGGAVVLFPSGVVASSDTAFGPVQEREWNPFTAKMIAKSGAAVVPIRFTGANSRAYQVAGRLSATLRQGLLIHEVVRSLNRPQAPVIGAPFDPAEIEARAGRPRELMAWLRERTLSL